MADTDTEALARCLSNGCVCCLFFALFFIWLGFDWYPDPTFLAVKENAAALRGVQARLDAIQALLQQNRSGAPPRPPAPHQKKRSIAPTPPPGPFLTSQ